MTQQELQITTTATETITHANAERHGRKYIFTYKRTNGGSPSGIDLAVNSGYRSPALNKAVGGVSTSQHLRGEAADITAGTPAENKRLFDKIVELQKAAGRIAFDQLIDESGYKWIHISYRAGANRNQTLHLK